MKSSKSLALLGVIWAFAGMVYCLVSIIYVVDNKPNPSPSVMLSFLITTFLAANLWIFEVKMAFPTWKGLIQSPSKKLISLFRLLLKWLWMFVILQSVGTFIFGRYMSNKTRAMNVEGGVFLVEQSMELLLISYIMCCSLMLLLHCLLGINQFIPNLIKRIAK